jgi:aminopeptidase YwaD
VLAWDAQSDVAAADGIVPVPPTTNGSDQAAAFAIVLEQMKAWRSTPEGRSTKERKMKADNWAAWAEFYLETLCGVKPNRRTGSPGNWEATEFFAETVRGFGYEIDAMPFECLDHVSGGAELTCGESAFEVRGSPYSLGCDVKAELLAVSTAEELEGVECEGKLLLMRGPICSEQLMPKSFVFYNPEHHQRLIALLERKKPAAIITATARNPDQVGALYPFPLIVDGDFDIPNMHCTDVVGGAIAALEGETCRLTIDARRVASRATNVIAKLNGGADKKIVLTAHIDAYEGSPGASDNASGVVALLLCAELLADYGGDYCLEIAALNGEDHYSAGGQMDYLNRYGAELGSVLLAVNVDDVGFERGKSHYSFYGCPPDLEAECEAVFGRFSGLASGAPWYSGDHTIFVQRGVPAVAFTAESMPELMRTVTHTAADTPDIVEARRLVEVAEALNALVRAL